jgi:hypothetical protein
MTTLLESAPDVSAEDYILLGLATCFLKDEDGVHEIYIVEPMPSSTIETLMLGIATSYQLAIATTVGNLLQENPTLPEGFPPQAQFCADFANRLVAAARTYKAKPSAQSLVPLGSQKNDFNYSTERKRVLNSRRSIGKDDNVKQHKYTHQVL